MAKKFALHAIHTATGRTFCAVSTERSPEDAAEALQASNDVTALCRHWSVGATPLLRSWRL